MVCTLMYNNGHMIMLLSVKLFDTPTHYVSIYLHNYMDDYSYVSIFVVDSTLITFKENTIKFATCSCYLGPDQLRALKQRMSC